MMKLMKGESLPSLSVRIAALLFAGLLTFAPQGFSKQACEKYGAMAKPFDLKKLGLPKGLTIKTDHTQWPYHQPDDMQVFNRYSGFDLTALAEGRRYIWVIDAAGTVRVAREIQRDHNPSGHGFNERKVLTHFDLLTIHEKYPEHFNPSTYDVALQPARVGGGLYMAERGGKLLVNLSVSSPYLEKPTPKQIETVKNYFIYLSNIGNHPLDPANFLP